ncbi:MAG TPA: aminotransferase class III-fold pyridoxal phosphate-dependent enzyme, partial [Candidatus Norongarragalinales archaeon]|nr:aminotransferase class III-fold pyridoxal phosphate-dependent enzyme [Candidatus Norongarragalinales archaeon]
KLKKMASETDMEVRGQGLMIGFDLKSDADKVVSDCLEKRLLVNKTSQTVLRFLPPLIAGKNHVDPCVDTLNRVLFE